VTILVDPLPRTPDMICDAGTETVHSSAGRSSGARYRPRMAADDVALEELEAQEDELQFSSFTNTTAWELGCALVDEARRDELRVTIDIRRGDQQLFHVALEGTTPNNDVWIERKNRVVRRFGHSSLYMGVLYDGDDTAFAERERIHPEQFAAHGGAFPIIVRGVGMIGTVTVSGLPQEDDHRLVVTVLRTFLAAS
jgi:uncharacterized protein (UPF0303 family)